VFVFTNYYIFMSKESKNRLSRSKQATYVEWVELNQAALLPGDMWTSCNPNDFYKQGNVGGYNLQMQAVHRSQVGLLVDKKTNPLCGHGSYWRPIAVHQVPVGSLPFYAEGLEARQTKATTPAELHTLADDEDERGMQCLTERNLKQAYGHFDTAKAFRMTANYLEGNQAGG